MVPKDRPPLTRGIVGACIAIYPEKRRPLLVLPGFLFVRMALNAIDGMLAREHAMKSRLGAVLPPRLAHETLRAGKYFRLRFSAAKPNTTFGTI
jgi:hypothetical protein